MLAPRRCADFFLIGAPRCGTTALSRYLAQHPAICFSRPKEPHYFSRLEAGWTPAQLERDYLQRYFGHLNASHRLLGEGSVSYLYASDALAEIMRLNPAAKMLVMLRNPLEMLPSYHLRMHYIMAEDVEDFPTAWLLQEERAQGRKVPATCPDARLLRYRDVASFGAQLERLFAIADREQCLILLFDDLLADPLGVYRQALRFLGVEYDGLSEFSPRESSRSFRHRFLQRLLWSPPKSVRGVVESAMLRAKQLKRPGRKSLLKRLARWNSIPARPAPLSRSFRATLRNEMSGDIRLLGELIGRDLDGWLEDSNGEIP